MKLFALNVVVDTISSLMMTILYFDPWYAFLDFNW